MRFTIGEDGNVTSAIREREAFEGEEEEASSAISEDDPLLNAGQFTEPILTDPIASDSSA